MTGVQTCALPILYAIRKTYEVFGTTVEKVCIVPGQVCSKRLCKSHRSKSCFIARNDYASRRSKEASGMIGTIMRLLMLVSVFVFCFCALPDSRYPSLKGLHKTVIFDQTMTEEDIAVTKQVMNAWECSTNNRIQFTYIQYPSEQELADITDLDHSVIIKNVETDDPRIHDRNGSMPPGTYTVAI